MTVLEKIKRCVSLVWDFQEIYGEEDIEDFCHYELSTYPQHDEIMEYFKQIEELEKENAELLCQKNRNKSCYSCANATERCFRNEIGCPCQNYKSYKDENAELKEEISADELSIVVLLEQTQNDLFKAKEIIKTFLDAKSIEETCVAESEAEEFLRKK